MKKDLTSANNPKGDGNTPTTPTRLIATLTFSVVSVLTLTLMLMLIPTVVFAEAEPSQPSSTTTSSSTTSSSTNVASTNVASATGTSTTGTSTTGTSTTGTSTTGTSTNVAPLTAAVTGNPVATAPVRPPAPAPRKVLVSTTHIATPYAPLPPEALSVADLYGGRRIVAHGTAPYALPLGSAYHDAKLKAQDKIYKGLRGVTIAGSLTIGKGSSLLKVDPHQLIGNPSICTLPEGEGSGITHNFTVADVCLQTDYAKIATRILSSKELSAGVFKLLPDYKGDPRYAIPKTVPVPNHDAIVIDARGLGASISILPRVTTPTDEVVFTPLSLNRSTLNQGKYYTFQTQMNSFVGNGVRFSRPLYVKALDVRKNSDFVVSEYSASMIISAHRRYGILSEAAVFFVID